MDSYEDGINRLIEEVKRLRVSRWNPTPFKNEAKGIAAQIDGLLEYMDVAGFIQAEIEQEHDHREGEGAYASALSALRALRESALRYSESIPDSRERPEMSFAALALLHLRYHYWPKPVKFNNTGPDVKELQRVCEAAGIVLGLDSYRKALSKASEGFNPYIRPLSITKITGF